LTLPLSPEPFSPAAAPPLKGQILPGTDPHPEAGAHTPWLEALLDNVRSAWNVGAIFRTADGLGVRKLHLGGITPTPENKDVHKTSLGAELSVAWAHNRNALAAARELKSSGYTLLGLEQADRAESLEQVKLSGGKSLLVVGNEVTGVDPAILELCERVIYIPMRGQKRSLNVEMAFGIATSRLLNE
jgi:tRNA G18 (ribose-2'-O)-methylase SpoU